MLLLSPSVAAWDRAHDELTRAHATETARFSMCITGNNEAPPKGQQPQYSLSEVAKHNTPEDCWVIVHGSVYDVSSYVPRHPGGAMIYVKAGGECSQLFDSYHPLRARYAAQRRLPLMIVVRSRRRHCPDSMAASVVI